MKNFDLKKFVALKSALYEERNRIQRRLQEIQMALGDGRDFSQHELKEDAPARNAPRRTGRRGKRTNALSLKKAVLQVLQDKAMSKKDILEAVGKLGYKFGTSNPMNSLGVILYGKNPKFKNTDGKFSLS
jgi:hypothetical protein